MAKGKIVLIPFPFDDLSTTKVRPALCLTGPIGSHRHIVLAFLTSTLPVDRLDSDIVLDDDAADFSSTGLHVTSTLRLHRLMTVSADLIMRELGELPMSLKQQVDETLAALLQLRQT